MNEDIQHIIEKHLPSEVGKSLAKRLEQAEADKKTVQKLEKTCAAGTDRIKALEKEVARFQDEVNQHDNLDTRKLEVEKREREQRIRDLENHLACAERMVEFADKVCSGLTRNMEYRKSLYRGAATEWASSQSGVDWEGKPMYEQVVKGDTLDETHTTT